MSEQLSFADLPAAPRSTDRLFFALFPDDDVAVEIAELTRRLRGELGLKGKPIATDRLHVTLHFLGDFPGLPKEIIASASAAAESLTSHQFEVMFDRVMSFAGKPHNRPFVLRGGDGLVGLTRFQGELAMAMAKSGQAARAPRASFTPHVTLLYDDLTVAEQPVASVRWTVRELVLVHSVLDQNRHVHLARWSLNES
jgi:2'-5' RNA ligase